MSQYKVTNELPSSQPTTTGSKAPSSSLRTSTKVISIAAAISVVGLILGLGIGGIVSKQGFHVVKHLFQTHPVISSLVLVFELALGLTTCTLCLRTRKSSSDENQTPYNVLAPETKEKKNRSEGGNSPETIDRNKISNKEKEKNDLLHQDNSDQVPTKDTSSDIPSISETHLPEEPPHLALTVVPPVKPVSIQQVVVPGTSTSIESFVSFSVPFIPHNIIPQSHFEKLINNKKEKETICLSIIPIKSDVNFDHEKNKAIVKKEEAKYFVDEPTSAQQPPEYNPPLLGYLSEGKVEVEEVTTDVKKITNLIKPIIEDLSNVLCPKTKILLLDNKLANPPLLMLTDRRHHTQVLPIQDAFPVRSWTVPSVTIPRTTWENAVNPFPENKQSSSKVLLLTNFPHNNPVEKQKKASQPLILSVKSKKGRTSPISIPSLPATSPRTVKGKTPPFIIKNKINKILADLHRLTRSHKTAKKRVTALKKSAARLKNDDLCQLKKFLLQLKQEQKMFQAAFGKEAEKIEYLSNRYDLLDKKEDLEELKIQIYKEKENEMYENNKDLNEVKVKLEKFGWIDNEIEEIKELEFLEFLDFIEKSILKKPVLMKHKLFEYKEKFFFKKEKILYHLDKKIQEIEVLSKKLNRKPDLKKLPYNKRLINMFLSGEKESYVNYDALLKEFNKDATAILYPLRMELINKFLLNKNHSQETIKKYNEDIASIAKSTDKIRELVRKAENLNITIEINKQKEQKNIEQNKTQSSEERETTKEKESNIRENKNIKETNTKKDLLVENKEPEKDVDTEKKATQEEEFTDFWRFLNIFSWGNSKKS